MCVRRKPRQGRGTPLWLLLSMTVGLSRGLWPLALASGVAGGVDGVEGEMARPEEGSGADGIGAGRAIEDVASRAKRVRTT